MLAGMVLFMSCAGNDVVRSPWAQHALYLEDTISQHSSYPFVYTNLPAPSSLALPEFGV